MNKNMSKSHYERDDAAAFYRENMHSYLRKSPLPPTEWELKQQHQSIQQETINRYGLCDNNNNDRLDDAIKAAYDQVKQSHKEQRYKCHIESVLGRWVHHLLSLSYESSLGQRLPCRVTSFVSFWRLQEKLHLTQGCSLIIPQSS